MSFRRIFIAYQKRDDHMPELLQFVGPAFSDQSEPGFSLTREHVYELFDQATVSRGEQYYAQKRVVESGWSPAKNGMDISAEVRGTRKYGVLVELRFRNKGNPIQRTDCSCPVAFRCKHAVALLLDFIAYREEQESFKGLGSRVAAWLADIKEATDELSPLKRVVTGSSDKRVLYIVDSRMDRNLPRLFIRPHTAARKKSGEFGSTQGHYFCELARSRAQFLQSSDSKLLHMYAMSTTFRGFEGEQLPDDPAVLQLLISMTIATGRCHWKHPNNPPLKLAGERNGSIGWRLTAENGHIPELKVEGDELLPLFSSFPLYVDIRNWELGPLKLDVPWKIADSFLAGPAIKPEELEKVSEILLPLRSLTNIPLPPSNFQLIKVSSVPKPRLTLHTIKDINGFALPKPQHYAVLRFEYDGIEIKGRNPSPEIRTRLGEQVTCLQRDLDEEGRIISQLLKTGLMKHQSAALPFEADELVFKAGILNSDQDWLRWLDLDFKFPDPECLVAFDMGFGLHRKQPASTVLRFERTADWWFNLNLGINVDGKNVSLLPILKQCFDQFEGQVPAEAIERMSVNGKFYARLPDGAYVGLPVDQVKDIYGTLLELFVNSGISDDEELEEIGCSPSQALTLKSSASFRAATVECDEQGARFLDRLKAFSSLEDFNEPANFTAQLRPYQKHGCAWLQFLSEYRLGGILADDMGLGKTIQVLAHLVSEKESGHCAGPSLVVCPTSVGPNWVAEAARHSPSLKVALLTSGAEIWDAGNLQDMDVLITSYGLMLRHAKELSKYSWHAVVLDEAQFIKNFKAKMAQAAGTLKAHHRLCLTGTPIENHLGELWSQFNFAIPGLLGDSKTFQKIFRIPIEKFNDGEARKRLISRIKSFVLRRTKDQVLTELPAKTVIVKAIELEGGQRELYEVVRLAAFQKVRDEIASRGLHRSQITILAELMKLRQVCCDPRLPKMDSPYKTAPSMKLQALMEMLEKLHEEGRKTLVFSQFTSMLDLIEPELRNRAIEFVTLRGSTKNRSTPVARFQNGEVSVFLLSLKAGGTGLNLTAADTVIHYDLWWNPAVESKATDRAHRIGQTKPVFVYKLVGRGTIEQRMLELQAKKNRLVQAILNDDSSMLSKFNEADINALFDPIDVEYTEAADSDSVRSHASSKLVV